jgi:hypothetical protein
VADCFAEGNWSKTTHGWTRQLLGKCQQNMKPNIKRIREIFEQALEKKDPAEREAYLAQACAGDAQLRREVESLLRADDQPGDFLGMRYCRNPFFRGRK